MTARLTVILLTLVSCLLGCYTRHQHQEHAEVEKPNTDACRNELGIPEFAVLEARQAESGFGFPRHFTADWNPSVTEVAIALRILPCFLQDAKTPHQFRPAYAQQVPILLERIPQSLCQAVGVHTANEKGILLNFIPSHRGRDNWRYEFIRVIDGGSRFWSVVYLTEEQRFTHLSIDLGF